MQIALAFFAGLIIGWLLRGGQRARLVDTTPKPIPPNKIAPAAAAQDAQVLQLLRSGRKIDAIKHYRELTGCDLKDAKDAIDQLH